MEEKLNKLLSAVSPLDDAAMEKARERQAQLAKPPGSLGRVGELSGPLAGGRALADTIQRVSHEPLTVMMPQPAIAPATTTRVKMMLFWSLQVNFICIPPDCVPERFRIAARLSPMVRDACSIPHRISFCKYFLSFFDNFVKSDGNICTAPQNGVS